MTSEVLAPGIPGLTAADVEEIISRQDEPAWLAERRREAWRLYESMDLPDPGEEEWRRTNLREMTFPTVRAATLAVHAQGAVVSDLRAAAREDPAVEKYLHTIVRPDEWKFVALNAALWSTGTLVHVPRAGDTREPVQITLGGLVDGGAGFPRTLIVAEPESRVRIIDDSASAAGGFISAVTEIVIGDGARVEYYDINRWGDGVLNFKTVRAVLGRDAEFTALAAGIGSKLTKMRLEVEMPEPGARTQLLGVTFGSGKQHFDYNTLQNHHGHHTVSDLQFKSALTDEASLVWYGITRINHGASASEANQTSRNLLLSDHAKAAPIPILEIEAYDVAKCSHGATAGPVEETELFYLESRGISKGVAEHMLVEGFFADVIARIPDAALRERVLDAVLVKAGGRLESITWDDVLSA
ncbi:MAG TPA: Fe-S cluster assembly protein SufD [Dehalococcoidia bacterium]|nr:Fe-S cluster assembly protein SufD [Dehalococcoidia bacterium]